MGARIEPTSRIGEVHGIYTIVDVLSEKNKNGAYIYKGVCNKCGFVKFATYSDFHAPTSITTICQHLRMDGSYITRCKMDNKRIRHTFNEMMLRCYSENSPDYKWYGGKGIGICQEWRDNPKLFEEWSLTHGYDDDLTIDRIDGNKDYCPDNCQWISREENSRKAGRVNWITVGDDTLTGRQWGAKLGIGPNTINTAIRDFGEEKTKELIRAMLITSPSEKCRKSNQSWFAAYGIEV
jgi:hypothetical protein